MGQLLLPNFEITTTPQNLPGNCYRCGGSIGTPGVHWLLDLANFFPGYGVPYLCNRCFGEAASLAGFYPVEKAISENLEDKTRVKELQEKLDIYERLYSGLRLLGIDLVHMLHWLAFEDKPGSSKRLEPKLREIATAIRGTDESEYAGADFISVKRDRRIPEESPGRKHKVSGLAFRESTVSRTEDGNSSEHLEGSVSLPGFESE